jgi:hypothetical protein
MIQGHVKLIDSQHKVIVRTEYDDLIVLRVLDRSRLDIGDIIVGSLDCQGESVVLDINKQVGVRVYVENGRRLFASARLRTTSRHSSPSDHPVRRLEA